MRFIKKANINQLKEITETYKEIELFIDRADVALLKDKVHEINSILYKQHAVIRAIHCPSSRYKTICDENKEYSTNAMSLCEIIADKEERELFDNICQFANECGQEFKINVLVIVHTGCVIGCIKDCTEFQCSFSFENSCFFKDNNDTNRIIDNTQLETLVNAVGKYKNIVITYENITPFKVEKIDSDFDNSKNFGYEFENVKMAEICNKILANSKEKDDKKMVSSEVLTNDVNKQKFGTVLDVCHILANHKLLEIDENLSKYIDRFIDKNKDLLQLIHLSNYDPATNRHGKIFEVCDEGLQIIKTICLKKVRNTPITLEVEGGEDIKASKKNFDKIMLEWNKVHTLFELCISKDTYMFFENLYMIMSIDYKSKSSDFFNAAKAIKEYVCAKSKLDKRLFDFTSSTQQINVYAFQLQAYIYYMRYSMLALELMKEYNEKTFNDTLNHYIFNDKYSELKFEGVGYYYNIYWKRQNMTLFHCYDRSEGGKWHPSSDPKCFESILKKCKAHIEGNPLSFYSTSKYFGRCMMKYFNDYSYDENVKYNICIYQNAPINYVKDNDNLNISLQEYQERCLNNGDGVDFKDFSIDFSEFLKDRDDDIASLNTLFMDAVGTGITKETCGSVYDGEVIFYQKWSDNACNIKSYKLSSDEFYILMTAYFQNLKSKSKDIDIIIEDICKSDIKINLDSEKIITASVKKDRIHVIKEILSMIDFDLERSNQPDKYKETYGTTSSNLSIYIRDLKDKYLR